MYLQDLSELLNDPNNFQHLVIPHLDLIIEMIEKNIFRPLPILKKQNQPSESGGIDEDEQLVDLTWPHL